MAYDMHAHLAPVRKSGGVTWEYRLYFVAIFLLIALPTAIWRSTAGALQPRRDARRDGMVHGALRQSQTITSMIFSA